jgi:hypothetical protein
MTSQASKNLRKNNLEINIPTFTTFVALRGVSIPHKINTFENIKFE